MKRIFALTVFLVACSPVYRTDYTLTPPSSWEGKGCVQRCEDLRLQCEDMQRAANDACRDRAERSYATCIDQQRFERDPETKVSKCVANCSCYKESCSSLSNRKLDDTVCQARFYSCFEMCGGKVQADRICVAHCSE